MLVEFGGTRVLCAASCRTACRAGARAAGRAGSRPSTPCCRARRTPATTASRCKGKIGGRTQEISRLIGRSLRACVDYKALGENTIIIDCDVLQADGGTRTAAITGAYVALADAVSGCASEACAAATRWSTRSPPCRSASSDGTPMLDLCYTEDVAAETDMNVVMTGTGEFVEVQGTAEGAPFDRAAARRAARPRASPAAPS